VHPRPLLTEEDVLSLLDARHGGWASDREGWVTLEHQGIAWRVHYRRGELVEVGWWDTPARPAPPAAMSARRAGRRA
jgi:hypothetical protein